MSVHRPTTYRFQPVRPRLLGSLDGLFGFAYASGSVRTLALGQLPIGFGSGLRERPKRHRASRKPRRTGGIGCGRRRLTAHHGRIHELRSDAFIAAARAHPRRRAPRDGTARDIRSRKIVRFCTWFPRSLRSSPARHLDPIGMQGCILRQSAYCQRLGGGGGNVVAAVNRPVCCGDNRV